MAHEKKNNEQETTLSSCSFLFYAFVKQNSALAGFAKNKFPDVGNLYTLAYRSFDLLFHSSIQQGKNGHLLKPDGRFYSLAEYWGDSSKMNNPVLSREAASSKGLPLLYRCANLCSNTCTRCGGCVTHPFREKCSCILCLETRRCESCLGFSRKCELCERCRYRKDSKNITLQMNGIHNKLLHSDLSSISGDVYTHASDLREGSSLYQILYWMYKLRNEDQHGIIEMESFAPKVYPTVLAKTGIVLLAQVNHFSEIAKALQEDYKHNNNSCRQHENQSSCLATKLSGFDDMLDAINKSRGKVEERIQTLKEEEGVPCKIPTKGAKTWLANLQKGTELIEEALKTEPSTEADVQKNRSAGLTISSFVGHVIGIIRKRRDLKIYLISYQDEDWASLHEGITNHVTNLIEEEQITFEDGGELSVHDQNRLKDRLLSSGEGRLKALLLRTNNTTTP